ncbi:MAG: excinuclease ABC subunit UvrC [Pseudomonadota bacterium]
MSELARRIDRLPRSPGVYLFKGGDGTVLYVGKAVSLRARVRQYFAGGDGRIMVPWLVSELADVEVVLTSTEKEALILENTLIKRFRPRYNAQLRDDKNFLHLRLDPAEIWPRLTLRRRIQPDGARYFGPYHSAARARQTLDAVQRHFPLRRCSDRSLQGRRRPCLLHQLHRCSAPCVGLVSPEAYAELAEEASLFLAGRSRELLQRLEQRMLAHAEAERFEEAARLRDLLRAIEATIERQRVVDRRLGDRDVWGLFREGVRGVAAILPVRGGYLLEPEIHRVEGHAEDDAALLSSLLLQHYDPVEGDDPRDRIPPELLLPQAPADAEALAEVLGERRGTRVHLHVPARGDKHALVDLAARNARERFLGATSEEERAAAALAALAEVCRLPAPPRRIECFDNSNLQGGDPVASMVVFVDGRPARAATRRYRIKTVQGVDDYGSMREILGRRLRRGLAEGALPDLLVVDGGHGQVSAARAVLADLGIEALPVIGLVKPRTERAHGQRDALDRIVLPALKEPLRLKANHPALRLLQHLRDESHATAVRYHRKVRSKRALESALEALPGVGPARRTALLRHFGSARHVAEASLEELCSAPGLGPALARRIHAALHPEDAEG